MKNKEKRGKFYRFIAENKRPLAVLALFFAAWLFIVLITYDNWYFYVPWHKAHAVKTAQTYLSQTYDKSFDIEKVNLSLSGTFSRLDENHYSKGVAEMKISDENGLEADITVNRNYQITADDYMCVYADDMLNKHFDEIISASGLDLVSGINFEADKMLYSVSMNDGLKPLARKDKVDKDFFRTYSQSHFWVYIAIENITEQTAPQINEVIKTVCNSGMDMHNGGFSIMYINRGHPVDLTYTDLKDDAYVLVKIRECLRYLK